MSYYEVIFETGSHSIMQGESDEEVLGALKEQNRRASAGEAGRGSSTERSDLQPGDAGYNPSLVDYPAERVVKVLKYDEHPADYNQDMTMSADVLKSELDSYLEGKDVVNLMELSGWARDLANPVKTEIDSPHDSQFKAEETEELDLSSIDAE